MTTNGRFALPLAPGLYYNMLTHKVVHGEELGNKSMLAGQERQAILDRLMQVRSVTLTVIPSMECNLRCPHCYVRHLLKKPSGNPSGDMNPEELADFAHRLNSNVRVDDCFFVGGEPFLHPRVMERLMDVLPCTFSVTTNGVWDWTALQYLLPRFSHMTFSIDGLPEDHNQTRRSLDGNKNVFQTVYQNLHRVRQKWPHVAVRVQGSTVFRSYSAAELDRYAALMVLAGVNPHSISLGPPATTKSCASKDYLPHVKREIRLYPCCDHSYCKQFVVYQGAVYNTYYRVGEVEPLGLITDSIPSILEAYRNKVLEAAFLTDDVCMNECQAVGVCWGLCTNARHVYQDGKPSSVCDRQFKEEYVRRLAAGEQPVADPVCQ